MKKILILCFAILFYSFSQAQKDPRFVYVNDEIGVLSEDQKISL